MARTRRVPLSLEALEERLAPAVYFWSGGAGASDTNWTTAANWAGGVAPSAGDDLVFANGVTQTNTTNDFAAGTSFGSIAITGSGYSLVGNAVTLQGSLTDSGGNATVSLPLTLGTAESILNTSGGMLTLGAIDTNGNALTLETDSGTTTVNGQISGSGGLVKTGSGEMILTAANSYSGGTQINAGTLDIQNAQALGTTDGTAATGTTINNSATLLLDGSFTVANELLTFNSSRPAATLQSNGNDVWTGNVSVNVSGGPARFAVSSGRTLTMSGNVTGSGAMQATGGGQLTLTGDDALTLNAFSSTLELDGSLNSEISLGGGATLQGPGTVAGTTFTSTGSNVYSTGTVGDLIGGGGTIDPAGTAGTAILQTGALTLNSGTTLAFELNSDTAGSGYDQLQASGSVNLSGAKLQVSLGYTPSVGQQFTLIQNNSGSAVVGTFNGYAEGSLVFVGNVVFQITYAGGASGYDVVLTVKNINPPTAVTATGGYSFSATVGNNSSVQTVASFTDSSPNKILDYQTTVDWGDKTTSIATLANGGIVQNGNTFFINLSHDYTSQGTFTITTIVLHEGLNSNSVTSTATVLPGHPTISVTDKGGTYNGSAFAGTATVNGGSSLEEVAPTLTYYQGTYTLANLPSSGGSTTAPTNANNYTVVAYFPGSADYTSATALATFTIAQATPTVAVSDNSGIYTGSPYAATATVAGVVTSGPNQDSTPSPMLEGVAPTRTYYSGTDTSGTPLSGAPSLAGTYTVVAFFAGSTDYTAATAQTTFTISPATPIALNQAYTTEENWTLTVDAPGVMTNISPVGAPLTAELVSSPANGSLSLNADGSFTYTPATGFYGTDSFTYTADAGTDTSNVATVTLAVDQQGVVVNTNDSGPGSLRQAILDANANPAIGVISFDIPGSGVHTIQPLSVLPSITSPVTIDGTTQPGYSGSPLIVINGSQAGPANGLVVAADNTTLRGMVGLTHLNCRDSLQHL